MGRCISYIQLRKRKKMCTVIQGDSEVLNTKVAMIKTGAPWWRICVQISSAKIWRKLMVAVQFGAQYLFLWCLVTE
jgi:hypothetical protein